MRPEIKFAGEQLRHIPRCIGSDRYANCRTILPLSQNEIEAIEIYLRRVNLSVFLCNVLAVKCPRYGMGVERMVEA
jgi:hypothetical protein